MFTRTDKRTLKIIAVVAALIESFALRVFLRTPFDVEPLQKPGVIERWTEFGAAFLHFPAFPLFLTPLVNSRTMIQVISFIIGYIDILLLTGALWAIQKLIRRLLLHHTAERSPSV